MTGLPLLNTFTVGVDGYNPVDSLGIQPIHNNDKYDHLVQAAGPYTDIVTVTKLVHTTVLRTLTTQVPQTIVSTQYRVSTHTYGQSVTTLRSTSIFCIEPGKSRVEDSYEVVDPLTAHSQTPPLRNIGLGGRSKSSNGNNIQLEINPLLKPTTSFKDNNALYRTWIGTLVSNGDYNDSNEEEEIETPSKFILLQHLWPKGFILEDNASGAKQHISLTPAESQAYFGKRRLEVGTDGSTLLVLDDDSANLEKPVLESSLRQR